MYMYMTDFSHPQYLAWRVLTGLNHGITLSFMLVGHTKFSLDWCFGLFKQRYRRTFVSSLSDIANVVNTSADVNVAQLVGTQCGEPVVITYDWATFLRGHFRTLPQLKKCHHFIFKSANPGEITKKVYSDSVSTTFQMLADEDWCPRSHELPRIVSPAGLSPARQWYLYQQIREYCRIGTEDLTCPKPTIYLQSTESHDHQPSSDDADIPSNGPPPKRARRCGKCGGVGHTRRTCKDK